jgi:hypothetical protein
VVTVGSAGQRLADLPHVGSYDHAEGEEWVVPVAWQQTRPRSSAFKVPGLFANQNSATRLRNTFTLDARLWQVSTDLVGLEERA